MPPSFIERVGGFNWSLAFTERLIDAGIDASIGATGSSYDCQRAHIGQDQITQVDRKRSDLRPVVIYNDERQQTRRALPDSPYREQSDLSLEQLPPYLVHVGRLSWSPIKGNSKFSQQG